MLIQLSPNLVVDSSVIQEAEPRCCQLAVRIRGELLLLPDPDHKIFDLIVKAAEKDSNAYHTHV